MSMRYLGGFITASYNPLKVPNAPTIGTVTAGNTQVSVAFTAPSNVGGGAITSYQVLVRDSSSGATFTATGSASPIVVTGLTNGNTYTAQVAAVNSYGPSAYSASSGSFVPVLPFYLYSWGSNTYGELGQNNVIFRSSPVQVGALANWNTVQKAVQGLSIFATKTDGTIWSWGQNNYGQLGLNNTTDRSSPTQVGALTNWSDEASGQYFSIFKKTDGTLWSCGYNVFGQLGQNNTISRSSPVQVGSGTTWANISAGKEFAAATRTDGTLWTWGNNGSGQLGLNIATTNYRSSPTQVGALTTWLNVACGRYHVLAIQTDGTLWSWGSNGNGRLGQNNLIYRSSPVQVGALTTWSKIAAGYTNSLIGGTTGTMWACGWNVFGQLGDNSTINRSSPVQIGSLTTWSSISSNGYACAAIKTDGTLWAFGHNNVGQLGQGNTDNKSSPVQVGSLTTWLRVSAGYSTMAISN